MTTAIVPSWTTTAWGRYVIGRDDGISNQLIMEIRASTQKVLSEPVPEPAL